MSRLSQFDNFSQENDRDSAFLNLHTLERGVGIYCTSEHFGNSTSEVSREGIQNADIVTEDMHDGGAYEEQGGVSGFIVETKKQGNTIKGNTEQRKVIFQKTSNPAQSSQSIQGEAAYSNAYGNKDDSGLYENRVYSGNINSPYGNNQYSPYVKPHSKNNIGLIIGISICTIMTLIAFFSFVHVAKDLYTKYQYNKMIDKMTKWAEDVANWEYPGDNDKSDNIYDSYYYDDEYNYYYDNDQYYTLHNDIKYDLSYSIEFDDFEYNTKYDNVTICVSYPRIKGDNVPKLDKLNSTIQDEIIHCIEYFEEDYEEKLTDDDYFKVLSDGYVTYMDEEKLSIVFNETVNSAYFNKAYLRCININMEDGVVFDNKKMLNIDKDFSVEFRKRSDVQNDEIHGLTMMSEQEITNYFNSSNIIVFYTPKGMEIGFNYDEGWITVTYKEYEKYLRVF